MRHGFELIQEKNIPEINSTGTLWKHIKSGAEYLSLENDDSNKVFCIAFRTPPPNSTGMIHILEHSVLQGSRKYPVKDAITELVKGSMQTYINMLSYPDKTLFPVASQNLRDIYNMIDVFLDGVFYPLLTPETFKQEGWHYVLESMDAPLKISGVVYNEQKGNFAMDFKRIAVESQKAIFPENIYRHAFGGDPDEIPNLTYEQFKTYHQTYYQPSNARIFWYGDDDPDERLRYLDSWLKEFDDTEVHSKIPLQSRFAHPTSIVIPYYAGNEVDATKKKGLFTLNWLLDEVGDPELMLGLQILTYILIGTPTAPLRQALMASQMGDDLVGVDFWKHSRQMYFSIGLMGMYPASAEKLQTLILDTLANLTKKGLDHNWVAAAINTIEFQLRESNFGRIPRGLALFQELITTWIHGNNPLQILAFATPLKTIKARVAKGERYFEQLIRTYLLDNIHRSAVLLTPDPKARFKTAERDKLAHVKASLNQTELQSLVDETQALLQYQQKTDPPEVVAKIPALKLRDIDKHSKVIPTQVKQIDGCTTLYHDTVTNGILYLDLAFDLKTLPQDLIPYAPIFGSALQKMGTHRMDSRQLSQRIGKMTGGITAAVLSSAKVDRSQVVGQLVLRGRAMIPRADELIDILREILLETDFDDRDLFSQIVVETRSRLEANLEPLGFQVVAQRIAARYSQAGWLSEQLTGIEQIGFLRQLESEIQTHWPVILHRLKEIRNTLINRTTLTCSATLDNDSFPSIDDELGRFISLLPAKPAELKNWAPTLQRRNEGLIIPSPVNFVGKGVNLYDLGFSLNGSIAAIVNFLEMNWLWNQIRIQGGAYAGICSFDHLSGMFTFSSYRDPHVAQTINVYDQTPEFLRTLSFNDAEKEKCIIGALRKLDAHQTPDAKGFTSLTRYLTGETDQMRQQFRNELLHTDTKEFRTFADVLNQAKGHDSVVVMGSQDAIEQSNSETFRFEHLISVL